MVTKYFIFQKNFNSIKNQKVLDFIEKCKECSDKNAEDFLIEVDVENGDYSCAKVLFKEYVYESHAPWENGWYRTPWETVWEDFVPDNSWEKVEK